MRSDSEGCWECVKESALAGGRHRGWSLTPRYPVRTWRGRQRTHAPVSLKLLWYFFFKPHDYKNGFLRSGARPVGPWDVSDGTVLLSLLLLCKHGFGFSSHIPDPKQISTSHAEHTDSRDAETCTKLQLQKLLTREEVRAFENERPAQSGRYTNLKVRVSPWTWSYRLWRRRGNRVS